MFKRIIAIILICLTVCSLTACSATKENNDTKNNDNVTNTNTNTNANTNTDKNSINFPEEPLYCSDELKVADLEVLKEFQGKIVDGFFYESGDFYIVTPDEYCVGNAFDGDCVRYNIKVKKYLILKKKFL